MNKEKVLYKIGGRGSGKTALMLESVGDTIRAHKFGTMHFHISSKEYREIKWKTLKNPFFCAVCENPIDEGDKYCIDCHPCDLRGHNE